MYSNRKMLSVFKHLFQLVGGGGWRWVCKGKGPGAPFPSGLGGGGGSEKVCTILFYD
jgi:hypothetical protein